MQFYSSFLGSLTPRFHFRRERPCKEQMAREITRRQVLDLLGLSGQGLQDPFISTTLWLLPFQVLHSAAPGNKTSALQSFRLENPLGRTIRVIFNRLGTTIGSIQQKLRTHFTSPFHTMTYKTGILNQRQGELFLGLPQPLYEMANRS